MNSMKGYVWIGSAMFYFCFIIQQKYLWICFRTMKSA